MEHRSVRLPAPVAEAWASMLLQRAGVPAGDAEEVARHLLFAELRGVSSHGLCRLPLYLQRLEAGGMERRAEPEIVRECPVSALVDGHNGLGQVVARRAAELAARKAKAAGMAAVAVRNSNHCGCLAYYTLPMAEEGLIGFATTNAMATMPPHGGAEPFLGTNPISLAAPAGYNAPFVLDMAASQAARGKILSAAQAGREIPEGWALSRSGEPTTDPLEALQGLVLPMAGPKGSALAFMVEILAGILPGALVGPAIPREPGEAQGVGHFFLALRPDLFLPVEEFRRRMDRMMGQARQVRPLPGEKGVLLPGEIERLRTAENERLGIPLPPGLRAELEELAVRYGLPGPLEMAGEGVEEDGPADAGGDRRHGAGGHPELPDLTAAGDPGGL
ncbi:MAG: Ldh family oxidoreductase [Bacillota bacterium]